MPGYNSRMILGLLCLISVAAPVLIIGSQSRLGNAEHALYEANDCKTASSAALSSIGWLDVRPEPYEILGFCDVGRGLPRLGVSAMKQAVRRRPGELGDLLRARDRAGGRRHRSAGRLPRGPCG